MARKFFRLSKRQKRRNTWCISSFWGKDRRKIYRQDACGGYWYSFLKEDDVKEHDSNGANGGKDEGSRKAKAVDAKENGG